GLAAYRVVQEGLTNVLRHAGASSATVAVDWGENLQITVGDDGHGGGLSGARPGRGLLGLRERLAALGGGPAAGRAGGGGRRGPGGGAAGGGRLAGPGRPPADRAAEYRPREYRPREYRPREYRPREYGAREYGAREYRSCERWAAEWRADGAGSGRMSGEYRIF